MGLLLLLWWLYRLWLVILRTVVHWRNPLVWVYLLLRRRGRNLAWRPRNVTTLVWARRRNVAPLPSAKSALASAETLATWSWLISSLTLTPLPTLTLSHIFRHFLTNLFLHIQQILIQLNYSLITPLFSKLVSNDINLLQRNIIPFTHLNHVNIQLLSSWSRAEK